ncbi:MAG TPA: hypothetical protein VIM64_16945 [Puia sp.]
MKTRRSIFLTLAVILLVLNLVTLVAVRVPIPPQYKGDTAYTVGHYVGKFLFAIIALFLLNEVRRINKRIRARQRRELLNAFRDLPDAGR